MCFSVSKASSCSVMTSPRLICWMRACLCDSAAIGGLFFLGWREEEECFKCEQKFPEWGACVVDGVDVLVVRVQGCGCKEHPLVEVVARCKEFHFGGGLGVAANRRAEKWGFDG